MDKNKQRVEENRDNLARIFWHSVELKIKSKNKSMHWIAAQAGLNPQCVSTAKYLNSRIRMRTAMTICDVLECPIGELLYGYRGTVPSNESQGESEVKIHKRNEELIQQINNDFDKMTAAEKKAMLVHAGSYLGIDPAKMLKGVWL